MSQRDDARVEGIIPDQRRAGGRPQHQEGVDEVPQSGEASEMLRVVVDVGCSHDLHLAFNLAFSSDAEHPLACCRWAILSTYLTAESSSAMGRKWVSDLDKQRLCSSAYLH